MTRIPSIKTLRHVFREKAPEARRIMTMTRDELEALPAGAARVRECWHSPPTWDVRLHCLDALGETYGHEAVQRLDCQRYACSELASYLNTGDTYAPTVIYWGGRFRVQSIGDFIETMERRHIHFA